LPALERGTHVLDVAPGRSREPGGIEHRPPGREVDALRPVDVDERPGYEHLPGRAVQRVSEAVLVEVHEDPAQPAADRQVRENHLRRRVVVPAVVRRVLVCSHERGVGRSGGEDARRELVVSRTMLGIVWGRIAYVVFYLVHRLIVGLNSSY